MAGRSRFSLADLTVIGLAIMLLLALGLPALQASRERARRQGCAANLAALGQAMQSYHTTHQCFPPGIIGDWQYVAAEGAGTKDITAASGFTLLLPHLKVYSVYDLYDHDRGCATPANSTAVARRISVLNCPSNRFSTGVVHHDYYNGPVGVTDYAFNLGAAGVMTTESPFSLCTCAVVSGPWKKGAGAAMVSFRPAAGLCNVNRSCTVRAIKDGAATTFMIGEAVSGLPVGIDSVNRSAKGERLQAAHERHTVHRPWSQGYIPTDGLGGFGSVFAVTCEECGVNSYYRPVLDRVRPLNENQSRWIRATTQKQSNSRTGTFTWGLCGHTGIPYRFDEAQVGGFQSLHAGGAFFLLADGTVRWINETINPRIYVALSTINGREVIAPADF